MPMAPHLPTRRSLQDSILRFLPLSLLPLLLLLLIATPIRTTTPPKFQGVWKGSRHVRSLIPSLQGNQAGDGTALSAQNQTLAAAEELSRSQQGLSQTDNTSIPPSTLLPSFEVYPVCKVPGPAAVTLSSNQVSASRWQGWGTSLAWWANYAGGLPADQLDAILEALFNPVSGLGLNIVRYNIIGGYNATLSPELEGRSNTTFRAREGGFRENETSSYDWDADLAQRTVLLGAIQKGADRVDAISYSPPWWMTHSGDVSGTLTGIGTNLKPEYFEDFAEYLTEVVRHYKQDFGVTFESVGPVNEPGEVWQSGGRQEGSPWLPKDVDKILTTVLASLSRKGLRTAVAGTDNWPGDEWRYLRKLQPGTVQSLLRITTHGYVVLDEVDPPRGTERPYQKVQEAAAEIRKEVWMSEWCPMKYSTSAADIDVALVMGRYIVEAINIMGASAWIYWQAVERKQHYSLLQVNWDTAQQNSWPHVRTKKFYALKHFTGFVPPGSRPVHLSSASACEHGMAAFVNERGASIALLVVNQQPDERKVQIALKGFKVADGVDSAMLYVYRTSMAEDFSEVQVSAIDLLQPPELVAQGRSLTSFIFAGVVLA